MGLRDCFRASVVPQSVHFFYLIHFLHLQFVHEYFIINNGSFFLFYFSSAVFVHCCNLLQLAIAFFLVIVIETRSIYQYSNMPPRLSGQTSKFGYVQVVSRSLQGIKKRFAILTRKPRKDDRILIYRTWRILLSLNEVFCTYKIILTINMKNHYYGCVTSLRICIFTSRWGVGRYSLIWDIRGLVAGQGMVSWPRCPKQGIQFDLPLS